MEPNETKTKPSNDDEKLDSNEINLLGFSDCVLTCIFSYLASYDLYTLSKTCTRFKYLIELKKLWRRIDLGEHSMCARKFRFFFEKVNPSTDVVKVQGISPKEKTLTTLQFKKLFSIADNLTVLVIERQYINSDEVRLCQFPKNVREISLRGTKVTGKSQFLLDAHKQLVNLHTFILAECSWVNEHSLMALSKLTSLENLSLESCRNLNDSVAYMSVTARFGFQRLLRIDARLTSIGDQFLKCFHCIKTLREIYLEALPNTNSDKPQNIIEHFQQWYTSSMANVPNVVIFNPASYNLFNTLKKIKKPHSKPPSRNRVVNDCTNRHTDCNMETCSTFVKELKSPKKIKTDDAKQDDGEETEVLHNDDVSDTDDDSLMNMNFSSMFQSDVTDAGLQWFCSSDPQNDDYEGENSYLFKNPLKKCLVCHKKKIDKEDINLDQPGPSGLNTQSPSKSGPEGMKLPEVVLNSQQILKRLEEGHTLDGPPKDWFKNKPSKDRLVFKRKNESHQPQPRPKRPRTDSGPKSKITVDLNLGEGPLHLEIINERQRQQENRNRNEEDPQEGTSRQNNQQNQQNRERPRQEAEASRRGFEIHYPDGPPRTYARPQRREDDAEAQNRDLRVIIERLDPGLHIVIDRAGRIQFGPIRDNNYTKLKILMVRGYKMITDVALQSLADLRLEMLDVTGTSCTPKGVQEFLMVNPECKVIHESLNMCTCEKSE